MKISKFIVQGYRSFKEPQTLYFAIPNNNEKKNGLTFIVGENNAGKTSLLEALKMRAQNGAQNTLRSGDIVSEKELKLSIYDENNELKYALIPIRATSYRLKKAEATMTDLEQFIFIPSRRFWSPRVNNEDDFLSASNNINNNIFLRQNIEYYDNGNGIADLFSSIENNDEHYNEVVGLIRKIFPDFTSFSTRNDDTKNLTYRTADNIEHRVDFLGDGVISVMRIIAHLVSNADKIIVIDEPELSLHPLAQKRLANVLHKESKNRQIIISTHSPYFIDWEYFKNGTILNRIVKINDTESKIYSINFQIYENLLNGQGWQKPHMLDAVAKEIFFQDNILFLEGQEDVGLLHNEFMNTNINVFGYGTGGFSLFKLYLTFAKDIGIKKAAVIFDNGVDETIAMSDLISNPSFKTYKILQWNKEDIRDKPDKEGYYDKHGVKKSENMLDDFNLKISQIKNYFSNN